MCPVQGGSGDYFTLDRADWTAGGPVIIQPGEHVVITSGAWRRMIPGRCLHACSRLARLEVEG